jgi:hypothetical protein
MGINSVRHVYAEHAIQSFFWHQCLVSLHKEAGKGRCQYVVKKCLGRDCLGFEVHDGLVVQIVDTTNIMHSHTLGHVGNDACRL